MPHFDAVLFDLDGTLLYTLPDIHAAVCRALTLNGYGTHTMEDTRRFVGTGSRELVRKSLPADASPEAVDRVLVNRRQPGREALQARAGRGIHRAGLSGRHGGARSLRRRLGSGLPDGPERRDGMRAVRVGLPAALRIGEISGAGHHRRPGRTSQIHLIPKR